MHSVGSILFRSGSCMIARAARPRFECRMSGGSDVRLPLKLGSYGGIRTRDITRQFTKTADHMLRLV